jgi:uncharacterized membrane protein YfcA
MNLLFENYFYIIWISAFFTAIVSAVVGMIGGTMLLAVMAQYLKMEVLIPLHGLVQLTSNFSRAWFLRQNIEYKISVENAFGIILGSLLGTQYMIRLPEAHYNLFLGSFILFITFVPKFKTQLQIKGRWALLGFLASYLGLYVGAVGVLVGSVFLSEKLEKKTMIATQALCQSLLHFSKVMVFVYMGFSISPWLSLLAGTLLATSAGSWVGAQILEKIPEKIFRTILTVIVAALALRLIIAGFTEMAQ